MQKLECSKIFTLKNLKSKFSTFLFLSCTFIKCSIKLLIIKSAIKKFIKKLLRRLKDL